MGLDVMIDEDKCSGMCPFSKLTKIDGGFGNVSYRRRCDRYGDLNHQHTGRSLTCLRENPSPSATPKE